MPDKTDEDGLRYSPTISVWVRWFVVVAWLAQIHYRPDFASPNYIPNILLSISLLALNGYVHYRIRSNRTVTRSWMFVLSSMDVAMLTAGLAISGGFGNSFFVLYYPALAMFAVVFTSFRLSLSWATIVAILYAALSLATEPGLDFEAGEEKILFIRIVVMYAVVASVNLVSRFERIGRIEAVERERELQRDRIELSQAIHDTIAQSTYMIGLGLETANELARAGTDENRDELLAKLSATHDLSKSTMWELRHPIDMGPIFEGRELSRVLRSHASTFTTITSIPTDVVHTGREPDLPIVSKRLLFSIAHNAMTKRLPTLEREPGPHITEFRDVKASDVGGRRWRWSSSRLRRTGTRIQWNESRRRANGRRAGNFGRPGWTRNHSVLRDTARCRHGGTVD